MIYPWQQTQWLQLQTAKKNRRLSHALLINGMDHCGKASFALTLARSLMCQNPDSQGFACQKCKSCHLFKATSHPDFRHIQILEKKTKITIAQIRQLSEFLILSRSYGTQKIALISASETMSLNAANSLLKTLEEPTDNTLIILVTAKMTKLLPTIQSRCQQINFPIPNQSMALNWLTQQKLQHEPQMLLSIAANKPLLAKKLDDTAYLEHRKKLLQDILSLMNHRGNLIAIAKYWMKKNQLELLHWQLAWVQDMIIAKQIASSQRVKSKDVLYLLSQLSQQLTFQKLWQMYDELLKQCSLASHPLNAQLFTENMLVSWEKTEIK